MGNEGVRLKGFQLLIVDSKETPKKRWHSDYSSYEGPESCDNGLVMWIPLEESEADRNGMILAPGSHKELEDIFLSYKHKSQAESFIF